MNKVVIITSIHPTFDDRIFHKQARSLAKAGYDVTLVAQHERNEVVDGIKIIGLPKPRNKFQRIFGLSIRILHITFKEKADVYHLHDPELLAIVLFLRLFTKAKLIFDFHENVKKQILNKNWIPALYRRLASFIYTLIESITLKFIDYIIIAEDSYIENYRKYSNLIAIRNYVLLEYSQTAKIHKDNYQNEKKILIYAGGITKIRGAIEMIDALKILVSSGIKSVHLNLIGPISPDLRQELDLLIERYGLEPYVSLLGVINHSEVFDKLIKAHIGLAILHPDLNYVESLPTKFFEYMSTGLPVIASSFPLWKEIIDGSGCGLTVNPLDPKEIAEAIKYLLENPKLMNEMGNNGQKAVLERFSWEKESIKLLKLYDSLTEPKTYKEPNISSRKQNENSSYRSR